MISGICGSIITALEGITNVKKVGAWAGDLDTLLSMPQNMPGLYLIYQTAKFAQAPATMGTVKVDSNMKFQILLIVSSQKNPSAAATTAWGIIESVRSALVGLEFSIVTQKLWPESEELVFSEGGLLVYGMNYSLDVRI
jgi:hypothetical protein